MGRADPGAPGGGVSRRNVAALWAAGLIVAAAGVGCGRTSDVPAPLHVTLAADGRDTRVTLYAASHLKINARLAPALETSGGTVLRFAGDHLTPDSAYFAEPPSAVLPGHHDQVHGTLRASVCEEGEQVCRSVTLAL
jgi:hypothetical protein